MLDHHRGHSGSAADNPAALSRPECRHGLKCIRGDEEWPWGGHPTRTFRPNVYISRIPRVIGRGVGVTTQGAGRGVGVTTQGARRGVEVFRSGPGTSADNTA